MSKRDGRNIMKLVRCILIDTGMPQFLWGEICETTAYIINRCPHRALGGRSPYSQLYNRSSYLSSLHIIGVRAFVHNERHVHKLEQKAWGGLVIGYGKDSCSNRIYNPQTRRITESRNVTFMRHCPRHHHLLDKNNYSRRTRKLSRKKLITGTFLGIYRYLVHQTKIKTQKKESLAPSTSSGKKERTVSAGSAPRSPGLNSEGVPSSTGSSSDTPSATPYQLGHPFLKGQRHN